MLSWAAARAGGPHLGLASGQSPSQGPAAQPALGLPGSLMESSLKGGSLPQRNWELLTLLGRVFKNL